MHFPSDPCRLQQLIKSKPFQVSMMQYVLLHPPSISEQQSTETCRFLHPQSFADANPRIANITVPRRSFILIWLEYSELINRWGSRIVWVFFWLLCCQRTKNVKRRFRDYFLLLILWLWLPPWVFRITGNQSIVTWKNVNVEMTYPYNRTDGSLSHRSWKVDSKMGTDDVEINRILCEPSVVVE